jgi:hypothetical protein
VAENSDLQFERAQFDGSGVERGCKVCGTPLVGSYYDVNGHTVCERCCFQLRDGTPSGSRLGRVVRAAGAGSLAALGGAILYWAILAATGYEFGLIAIVVGFAVGKAVRWGSHGRGGWAYQSLAIALTYLAIVSGYVPLIVNEFMKEKPAAQTQVAQQASATVAADRAPAAPDATPAPGAGSIVLALGVLLLIVCAAPFLAGLQNIVGLIIIGIGVYEAWKLNKRVPLVITGPHVLSSAGAAVVGQ